MFSPRNHIELHHVMTCEVELADTLFEICDAEFNSRKDVHYGPLYRGEGI